MSHDQAPLSSPAAPRREGEPPAQPIVMLTVRFMLELVALAAIGWAGWQLGDGGIAGGALAIVFVIVAAGAWGAFAVPDDPSRNPTPVIVVPGWLRLAIELAVFGSAAWSLWVFVSRAASETFMTAVAIVMVVGWDRIWWMLRHR